MSNGDTHIARLDEAASKLIDAALEQVGPTDRPAGEAAAALVHVRAALGQLRDLSSISQMTERAPIELCVTCGFDRAAFFRVEYDRLIAESAHFTGDPDWCEGFLELALEAPIPLRQPLAEAEVVRQRRAMIIVDPLGDPRALCALMRVAHPESYVVAPVISEKRVVGMLHADRFGTGRTVDATDRDVLWAFAEGFGYALERVTLLERLRAQRARILESLDDEPKRLHILREAGAGEPRVGVRLAATADREGLREFDIDADDAALELPLTRRELEVLALVAEGATNLKIANTLVISEQTVKSHVKNILRKLGAANRTEAARRLGAPAAG